MPSKEEIESTVPKGFLDSKDLCVLPTFYQPETEELRWATHQTIRKTLFGHVWRQVKYCEFKRLKSEHDFFELESVKTAEEGFFDTMVDQYWSQEKQRGKLLQV